MAAVPFYRPTNSARRFIYLHLCEHLLFPVFAFCSQAKGFFEKYHTNTLSEKAIRRYQNDKSICTYKEIVKLSVQNNDTISHTALQLLERQSDFPVLSIIGPSNAQQLKSTLNIR